MPQPNVLKGLQIAKDIPYRDPEAVFALVGTDGMGKGAYLPVGDSMLDRHMLLLGSAATGKTNMLLHLSRNLRANLSQDDVIFTVRCTSRATRCSQTTAAPAARTATATGTCLRS